MAKPKFYLEPRRITSQEKEVTVNNAENNDIVQAINMYYSFNGRRLQYYTGIRIDIKYFRAECNKSNTIKPIKTNAPFAQQYNNKLIAMANDAVSIVTKATSSELTTKFVKDQLDLIYKPAISSASDPIAVKELGTNDFIGYFERLIEDTKSGRRVISSGKNNGSRYSRNAYKNYGITISAVRRYMAFNGIVKIPFEHINKSFYESFRNYCYNIENKEKSTFGCYIKDIRTVMNEKQYPGFSNKDFILPAYEADTLYLDQEQINKIESLDLSDITGHFLLVNGSQIKKISYVSLDKVRDLFLIGCFTGLRFSDFSTLEPKNIEGDFIKVKQTKTGGRITIPIMTRLQKVLNKYPESLPTISNQKFNDYIKIVAELAGLTQPRKVMNTKGNVQNESVHPLCDLITSHSCRRSYATNMFKAGVPPMLIMSATGHKTETSFLKYIRANNDDKAKLLADTLKKLGM